MNSVGSTRTSSLGLWFTACRINGVLMVLQTGREEKGQERGVLRAQEEDPTANWPGDEGGQGGLRDQEDARRLRLLDNHGAEGSVEQQRMTTQQTCMYLKGASSVGSRPMGSTFRLWICGLHSAANTSSIIPFTIEKNGRVEEALRTTCGQS
jgi:hypothetical protein